MARKGAPASLRLSAAMRWAPTGRIPASKVCTTDPPALSAPLSLAPQCKSSQVKMIRQPSLPLASSQIKFLD